MLGVSICGTLSAWFSEAARIPFVAGVDCYPPTALSRLQSRWPTPHVALVAQAIASTFAIFLSFLGRDVKVREAYDILLALTVVTQLVPFAYLRGSLVRIAGMPGGLHRNRWWLLLLGLFGLAATLVVLATAFIHRWRSSLFRSLRSSF